MKLKVICISLAMLCAAALFGFYFTMSFVIMPGFDASDPYAALLSNQQIGRTTKESSFFVALLGTPITTVVAVFMKDALGFHAGRTALLVALFGWIGMMTVTLLFNVPLNNILDGLDLSQEGLDYAALWEAYSSSWQFWNLFRVLTSGITVLGILCSTKLLQKESVMRKILELLAVLI